MCQFSTHPHIATGNLAPAAAHTPYIVALKPCVLVLCHVADPFNAPKITCQTKVSPSLTPLFTALVLRRVGWTMGAIAQLGALMSDRCLCVGQVYHPNICIHSGRIHLAIVNDDWRFVRQRGGKRMRDRRRRCFLMR